MLTARVVPRITPTLFCLIGLFAGLSQVSAASLLQSEHPVWLGEDGAALPFRNDEEVLEFLRTAEVVSAERTGLGINNPWRVELEKDGVRARACFRDVSVLRRQARMKDGFHLNFRDDAIYEVAAYELGRLLGIRAIPPTVKRRIMKRNGTLQLWVENTITEKGRLEQGLQPTNLRKWGWQYELMVLFDNLIYNADRNQGNILFDDDWKRWLIDHTRAFSHFKKLIRPAGVKRCERRVWDKLVQLDRSLLEERLGDYLSRSQISAILARRDLLLDHLQQRIDQYGEELILVEVARNPQR